MNKKEQVCEHWIDKCPVAEEYYENLLNEIIEHAEEYRQNNPDKIIVLTENDIIEPSEIDVWELLLGKNSVLKHSLYKIKGGIND